MSLLSNPLFTAYTDHSMSGLTSCLLVKGNWGQCNNSTHFIFALGPRFFSVTRSPDSASTSFLNFSLPRASPLLQV